MEYKSHGISRLLPFLCLILFIVTDSIQNHFTPWDPTHRWFGLVYAALFFLLLIYVLYDWIQMRRYYQNEGAQAAEKVRRKQAIWYWIALIACILAIALKLADFVQYQPIPAPL